MFVAEAAIVVHAHGDDASCGGQRGWDATGGVSVAKIETEAHACEMANVENFDEALRERCLIHAVFDKDANTKRTREGIKMFECCKRIFQSSGRPSFSLLTQSDNKMLETEQFCGLHRALDLVDGVDAAGFLRVKQIDGRCARATHFTVWKFGCVKSPWRDFMLSKPGCEFGNMFSICVIEVLTRRENLDSDGG